MKKHFFSIFLILCVSTVVLLFAHGNMSKATIGLLQVTGPLDSRGDQTFGDDVTDAMQINGLITTNTTFTTANSNVYYFRNSMSATSGTHNTMRVRAQSTAASGSTSDVRGVYAQAIASDGSFAGWVTSLYANPIAKGTSTSLGLRGILIDSETENTPTAVGNIYGIYLRTKSTVAVTTDFIGITIDNEKMGSGIVQDAGIQLKTTTWGSGVTAWTYGIDMNQTGAFGTADFRFMNGETIGNLNDGEIFANADLVSNTYNFGADGQADDDYEIAIPGLTALTTGLSVYFTATTANTDGATLEITSIGDVDAILKLSDQALATNDIEAGMVVHAVWDGSNWQMINSPAN